MDGPISEALGQVELCVFGQVVHRRRLSSRLLFYDLLLTDDQEEGGAPAANGAGSEHAAELAKLKQAAQGVELMIKADGHTKGRMPIEEVQRVRLEVKLGDMVRAYGWRENCLSSGAPVLHCTRLQAVRPWASFRKGNAQFVPQPHTMWRAGILADGGQATNPENVLGSLPLCAPTDLPPPRATPASGSLATAGNERAEPALSGLVAVGGAKLPGHRSVKSPHGGGASPRQKHANQGQGAPPRAGNPNLKPNPSPNPAAPLCKFFVNTGKCFYGDQCRFRHGDGDALREVGGGDENVKVSRSQWVQERYNKRRELAKGKGDPHASNSKAKTQRASVFVDWLVEKYGMEALCKGNGVLDVAGGRGSVSFELWTRRGIPCTLVDPRPLRFTKEQHKWLKGSSPDVVAAAKRGACKQLLTRFDPDMWRADTEEGSLIRGCSVVVGMHPDEATGAIAEFAGEFGKPFAVLPCCVFPRLFPNRFVVETPLEPVLSDANPPPAPPPIPPPSLPPSEDILDQALTALWGPSTTSFSLPAPAVQEPVQHISSENASENRQMGPDGQWMERVVTQPQLVQYLVQTSGASVEFLPFEGANQVVYTKPVISLQLYPVEEPSPSCCALGQAAFGTNILRWIGLCIL